MPVECCNLIFKEYSLYAVHIFREHNKKVDSDHNVIRETDSSISKETQHVGQDALQELVAGKEGEKTVADDSEKNKVIMERQCAKMLLTLLAEHNVSNTAIQTIIHFFTDVGYQNKNDLIQNIYRVLNLNSTQRLV